MDLMRREADYAVRIMQELEVEGGKCSTRELSARSGVSLDHVRKLMPALSRTGLVKATRGVRGGFRLSRPAREISLLSIVEAVQGKLSLNLCLRKDAACGRRETCRLRRVLASSQERLRSEFEDITLADLRRKEQAEGSTARVAPEKER